LKKFLLFHTIRPLDFRPFKRSQFANHINAFNVKRKLALFQNIAKSGKRHPSRADKRFANRPCNRAATRDCPYESPASPRHSKGGPDVSGPPLQNAPSPSSHRAHAVRPCKALTLSLSIINYPLSIVNRQLFPPLLLYSPSFRRAPAFCLHH
jgi:hypothetical protein